MRALLDDPAGSGQECRGMTICAAVAAGRSIAWSAHERTRFGPAGRGLALVLDQATKILLLYVFGFMEMPPGEAVPVLPFFNLVMVWNPGISYGLFPATDR